MSDASVHSSESLPSRTSTTASPTKVRTQSSPSTASRGSQSTPVPADRVPSSEPIDPATYETVASLAPTSHRWIVLSLLILVAFFLLWALPNIQVNGLTLTPKERVLMVNTLRDTWATIIAGAFFLVSTYFLWRYVEAVGKTVAAAERTVAAAEKSSAISQERHITERFVRVMELLGDEKLEVRLGGIYALERIARDSPADQSSVTEVLATYVREHAPWAEGYDSPTRVRADVQAILTVLGRRSWAEHEEQPLDLHETALATAYLPFAKLQRAFLYEANLRGAMLYRANLRGAWLWKAHLHNAILEGAHLEGADLTAAEGLTWEQLQQANIDKTTKLPDYLRSTRPDDLRAAASSKIAAAEPTDDSGAESESEVEYNAGSPMGHGSSGYETASIPTKLA